MTEDYREKLRIQIHESYGRLVYTQTTHNKQINHLEKRKNFCIKIQVITAALSYSGILSTLLFNQWIIKLTTAIVSTTSIGTNLYLKSANLSELIKQHQAAADDLWYIREKYVSLLTDFDEMCIYRIIRKRNSLQEEVNKIYRNSPKTDSKSYEEARNDLKNNEEQFFGQDELNKISPRQIRNYKNM